MPVRDGNTKIHNAGLAEEVAELVRNRANCRAIVCYLQLQYPEKATGITAFDVQYFKTHFVPREELLQPVQVREALEKQSAVIDVITVRAQSINMILEMIETIAENEKDMALALQLTGKSQLPRWLELLGTYLDAHKRDLADIGVLGQASTAPQPGASVNLTQNLLSVVKIEQSLVERGMDARNARDAILRAAYGPERLGEGKPVSVCAPALDDQGAAAVLRGASVPEAAVRLGGSGDSHQEGSADGDQ